MIPHFEDKKAELEWLRQNKTLLLHMKKAAIKYTDGLAHLYVPLFIKNAANKAESGEAPEVPTDLNVQAVLNTTNYLDSHGDVHLKGIWKKTLSDNSKNGFYLLQEHERRFDKVIAEHVKASAQTKAWTELGMNYEGTTQALVFDALVEPGRNPYMHEQYSKGRVREHSVGMYYDQILMAVNSKEKWWAEEKENWDMYVGEIINQEDLENRSMFWAVKSARLSEGSAVLMGSNPVTPTLSVTQAKAIEQKEAEVKNRFRTIGKKY